MKLLSWMLVVVVSASGALAARSPNVIIFYTDDMGNGDVGCYGAKDIRTPSIDALAAAGVRFTSYYAPAPICSPSRAAMLTGRYPTRAGMSTTKNIGSDLNDPGLSTREITIAEVARTRGYATAVFGKWHLGSIPECRPNAQGFDLFLGHHASCIDSFSHMYYASEPYHHDLYRNGEEVFEDGIHMTDLITRESLAFIDAHRDKPFLIYVAYNAPHYPMVAQSRYIRMYQHLPMPRRITAAMVAGVDDSVGRITARLRERGLLDDTLCIFASDNGAADPSKRGEGGGSNAPYREFKRSLFAGGLRLPGIMTWPAKRRDGMTCDAPVIGMDIFATAAQAMGAELPKDRTIDGRSWLGLFQDPAKSVHDFLCFEWEGQRATRSGRWMCVENGLMNQLVSRNNRAAGDDVVFLADATVDLGEQKNLRKAHPDVAERLLKIHQQWRESIAADPTASPDFLAAKKPGGGD